jgi:hypothetical protein
MCQWYVSKNSARNAEIEMCVRSNNSNPGFDHIVWFVPESDWALIPDWLRGEKVRIKDRLMYGDVLQSSLELNTSHPTIYVLANTDIIIPSSSVDLMKAYVSNSGKILCMARWEVDYRSLDTWNGPESKMRPIMSSNSQDTWVWDNRVVGKNEFGAAITTSSNVPLGIPGCDNRIMYEFSRVAPVANPSLSIKTFHIHKSCFRTYSFGKDRVPGPHKKMKPHM